MIYRVENRTVGQPLVSIILPTFNGELYISQAIDSILNQTYENWELIIQDDVSTDNTASIVKAYKDSRIKYECNPRNVGIAGNLNLGIRRAEGKYLSLFGQDDRMLKSYLIKQVEHLEKNKHLGFSFSAHFKIDHNGERMHRASHIWDDQYCRTPAVSTPAEGLILLLNYGCLPGNISPIVIRKKCLEEVGLFKEHYLMPLDWDMCIRLTSKFGFGFLNERLVEVRSHALQASRQDYNSYHNMKESFECLMLLKHQLNPCFTNSFRWQQQVAKGVARKYGTIFMHTTLRYLLSAHVKQSFFCAKLISRNIGLSRAAIYWLAYLPKRIKRRAAGQGPNYMSTVLSNRDLEFFLKEVRIAHNGT